MFHGLNSVLGFFFNYVVSHTDLGSQGYSGIKRHSCYLLWYVKIAYSYWFI